MQAAQTLSDGRPIPHHNDVTFWDRRPSKKLFKLAGEELSLDEFRERARSLFEEEFNAKQKEFAREERLVQRVRDEMAAHDALRTVLTEELGISRFMVSDPDQLRQALRIKAGDGASVDQVASLERVLRIAKQSTNSLERVIDEMKGPPSDSGA